MLIRQRDAKRRKIGVRLIAAGVVLIIVLVLIDIRVRPMIQAAGAFHCHVVATRIIDHSVADELERHTYDDLIHLTHDEAGNVIAIESNMASINRLKARVAQLINEDISEIEHSELDVPVGTITGFNMLYGRGPTIPVKLSPRGSAAVNLSSVFTSAGINQTLHQITLTVNADIAAIVPGYTTSVNVQTEFIVAQTVIVGTVPESYTHIILGDSTYSG
ncbi:MAG: sporulation protein YunB [Oscillospiraceae bacterium]|nr:sporulation protein YunB [Oscillospiraceae bacterium]